MKIKNFSYFRRAAASIALSFVISMSSVAGQFDALHQGIAQNTDTLIGNWQLFFPGLESQINAAFEEGRKTGNFIFHSNAAPVAWNVSENGTIAVNSINAGYFKSIRNPANHQLLFPGLSVDSQNVNISAGRDLIVTPVPVAEKGFGYALSVGPDQTANLSARNRIILMTPQNPDSSSYYDDLSVALADNASALIRAEQIVIFGGISAQYSRQLKMSASEGIYFLSPNERNAGTISTIQLLGGEMDLDAPDILIDRKVQIGQVFLGTDHPSSLNIGRDPQSGIQTANVFFSKEVDVEANSSLNLTSAQTAVFQGHLNLIRNAQADIRSRRIEIEKLFLGNLGSHARFQVDSDGHMAVHEPVSVGSSSGLTIDLGERSALSAAVHTHEGGSSQVTMHRNSYWFVPEDSNLSLVNVEPSSYIQLGQKGHPSQMETEIFKGNGAVFYLTAGSTGSLNIFKSSEGRHTFLLGSSGVSLANTGYLYHIAVNDDSPNSQDKATFSLANDGIIDAGPYMYKLGLYPFKKGDSRVWAILGTQSLKPVLPDNPESPAEPPDEVIPKPELPELPFDPTNPPLPDDSAEKPIGLSPAAKLTLASAASGNQIVQFLGSLDDLRSRMGEVREGAEDGSYILYRYDKSRFESHYSANSTFKYSAFTIGADRKFSSGWLLGANLLLTRGNIHVDSAPGSHSRVESVGAKFYAAWLGDKGQYIDSVLSVNRYHNKLSAKNIDESISTADYHNYGLGLSVEIGHRLEFTRTPNLDSWFIDPQVQLSYFRANGSSFRYSNDMKVRVKSADSLNGRLGVDLGRNFRNGEGKLSGQVYLRGGIRHDFLGRTSVQMKEFSFKDRSIGTRVYYGIGAESLLKDRLKAFAQINRESGSRLKTDFQIKVGLKYLF